MRGLTLGVYMIAVIFIFAQPLIKTNSTSTTNVDSVELKIEKTIEENAQKLEEIKNIKAANAQELKAINKIDEKRKNLIVTISKNIKKLLNKSPQTVVKTVYNTPNKSKEPILELSNIALDSVCVEEGRTSAFAKKECVKWEYFKVLPTGKDENVIIKFKK